MGVDVNNADVASRLTEIGELLELKGESTFKIRAYENAARALGNETQDVRELLASGQLVKIKGIGASIAKKVEELLDSGHIALLEELRREFPEGVRELLNIPGVGPSLARRVYSELAVKKVDDLRAAAEDGRLAALPGLGEKSAQNVIRALSRVNKRDSRISIGRAAPLAEEIIAALRSVDGLANLVSGGSLRRWAPTIGDLDIMGTSSDPTAAMERFVSLPQVAQVLSQGDTKSTIITDSGIQVDFRIVEAEAYGSLVQHFTGSRNHNIELREYALARGVSLNEYGIADVATGSRRQFADEEGFYRSLDLDYIPPELREGHGEISAARTHSLPELIATADIRGDLHVHTEWSDGTLPIEDMIRAARDRGYEYVAITDHSGGIGVAGGLNEDRLLEQLKEVRRIAAIFDDIAVLTGSEVDIRRDGSLDFPDDILEQLDWVVASVHSGFNQPEEQMTARMVRAIENPHVDAIGHPTGRLIGKREPYAVNLEAMFAAAARTKTALEINSFPERLDLVDVHARRAKDLGVMLVIDTDAHAPIHMDNIRYGVAMARRAWASRGDVLNTRSHRDVLAWIRRDVP